MSKPKTLQEFSRAGGKARWANVSPEDRSRAMKQTIASRWAKVKSAKEKL